MDKCVEAGLASRSVTFDAGITIGALMVANCYGAVIDPNGGEPVAAPKGDDGTSISYLESNASPSKVWEYRYWRCGDKRRSFKI